MSIDPIETLHKVVDKTKEDKKYDEKIVLQETNQKLLNLKEDVSYATVVLEQLKKTNWVDEQKFQALEAKLRNDDTKQEAIQEIARIIEDINARYENLHADEKEKVRKMTEALHETNKSISALKKEVMENPNYEAIEKELVDEAMKKLDEHRYTRWLKEPYKKHIHEQIEEMKSGKKSEEKKGWKKFVDGLSKWFFGLVGAMFIGKSITDLVADKLKVAKDKIKEGGKKIVDKAKEKIQDIKDKGKEVAPTAPRSPEELKEDEVRSKRYIKHTVKKYFKKDLTDEQVDRIAMKMKLSDQLKEGTSEWSKIIRDHEGNYLDATAQTIAMPFQIFGQLVGVLQEEGIVDMKDVALHLAGETVEYGLKGFELFGAGLATVCGKMDLKELNGHIAHLYEKSPTAAKQILFALIYRSMDGPLMKMVVNTGAFMAKAVIWPLVEARNDTGFVKNMAQDALKGNMNTAIRDMKETKELLKKCNIQDTYLQELMTEIERASMQAELYNNIVVEAQGVADGANYMTELKKKFRVGSKEADFIAAYEKTPKISIDKSKFLDNLGSNWATDTEIMGKRLKSLNGKRGVEFKNWGSKMFLGESSVRHLMIEFAHNIEAQGKVAHEMLANRNLFDQISHKMYLKKVRSMGEIIHGSELKDKAIWKFNTVEELSDFTENAKLLARKTPSTLKFLLGKAPIFIVGGLAMGEGDTISEKMHGLYEGLMGLVPIAGPLLILRDGLWAGDNTNWGQAAVGATLLGVDALHIVKAFKGAETTTKLVQMFTQPVVDMIEIGKFLRNSGKNSIKMVLDGAKLIREGKTIGMREKLLATLKGTPKKKWAVMAAVAAFGGWAIAEMIPDGIDKEAEVLFTKYKDDPAGLDKALAESWPTLDQDTKNECLKYALIAKLGISPEHADGLIVEYREGAYHVSLPIMIQKEYGNAMLASLKDSIARVEPDAKIEMNVRGVVAYNFRKQLEEKLKAEGEKPENIAGIIDKQLEAMGYNPNIGKQTT